MRSKCKSKHIHISHIKVTSESRVRFLGVYVDNRLSFDYHASKLCNKASEKLHALPKIFEYVKTSRRRVFVSSFIISQFCLFPSNLDVS